MPRTMTIAQAAALCAPVVPMALFCSLEFGDQTIYVWSGIGTTVWNGNTFEGVGKFGQVDGISEDSSVEAKGVTVTLSGIPSDLVSEVLNEVRVLGTCNIWLALYDGSMVMIGDPLLIYQGAMDAPAMKDDATECSITINLENILADLDRAVYRRYTDEDQQMDLADTLTRLGLASTTIDTGLAHVAGLQEQITFWGRMPSSVNNV